ncbi:hypothetical protein D6825_01210, partial [Candidatus Woesearchaeota archaeon]
RNTDTNFLYVIVWNLEKIADDYKYACEQITKGVRVTSNTQELIRKSADLLRAYYKIFYSFNVEELSNLSEEYKKTLSMIEQAIDSKNAKILTHIHHAVLKMADFSASIYALNS